MSTNQEYKNCEILNVYQKIMGNTYTLNEFLVEIAVKTDGPRAFDYKNIKIGKSNLYQELVEMLEGKRSRIYASYGMADIDIYPSKKGEYCIEWSPNETNYQCFYFKEKNFVNNFVKALEPKEEKEVEMERE